MMDTLLSGVGIGVCAIVVLAIAGYVLAWVENRDRDEDELAKYRNAKGDELAARRHRKPAA